MTRIIHPEWRDSNEATKYPFSDRAALQNAAGDIILEGTFLDAHLYPIGAGEKMYIREVELDFQEGVITIADAKKDVCTGTFKLPTPEDNIILKDSYGRPAGILVSERVRLAFFQSWGIGTHEFEQDMTEFVTTCCMPTPEVGVRGIQLEDGTLFTGNVWIMGSDGVAIRIETATVPQDCGSDEEVKVIRVDVVGDPLFRRRLCNPLDLFQTPNPVRKIQVMDHGVPIVLCSPDEYGNLSIQRNDSEAADSALRIRTTPEGLVFEVAGDSNLG